MAVSKPLLGTLVIGLIAVSSSQALAISRVDTHNKSCAAVKSIISNEGAVILRYPSKQDASRTLYDRYVRDRHSCQLGQVTDRTTVPTADNPACRVERCIWVDSDDKMRFRLRH